eukprot:gnl/TRDRNA2_/TRDRNA2_135737_c0_seq1.p1 gnl/TRDRNA2_/TRDRNA2_135737_c0~~gnl/TRDRNA2_/TRDRNA2_135737_c0_seq1.p1  ORF type:complete len:695 (-),score=124.68 gnl/TRDRNA2_/TRDRNA2_135737_c0_seq1:68-2152(-)
MNPNGLLRLCLLASASLGFSESDDRDEGTLIIQALIAVLHESSSSPEVQASAAIALSKLAVNDTKNRDEIRSYGGIEALIDVLLEGSHDAQACAVKALGALAASSHDQDVLREAGGIQALVQFLRDGAKEDSAPESAPAPPAPRADHRPSPKTAYKKIHSFLVKSLGDAKQDVRAKAAFYLGDLADTDWNDDVIRNHGGIPALIKVLRDGSEDGQTYAAHTLGRLAVNERNAEEIREEGGLPALIKVLRDGNEKAQPDVAYALRNLAAYSPNMDALREEGGIQILIKLLVEGVSTAKPFAAHALAFLAERSKNSDAIRAAGGIAALVNVTQAVDPMTQEVDPMAQEFAAIALGKLAKFSTNRDVIREERGIQALVRILRESKTEDSQSCAAYALGKLALNSQNCDVIRDEGAIEMLIAVLQHGRPEAQAGAANALRSMAQYSQKNRMEIREANGVQVLLGVLLRGEPDVQSYAAYALGNLATKSQNSNDDDSVEARTDAADALRKLAANSQNSVAIREEGGVQALIEILGEGNSAARAKAADALVALAWNDRQSRALIREEGGVQRLLQAISERNRILALTMQAWLTVDPIINGARDLVDVAYSKVKQSLLKALGFELHMGEPKLEPETGGLSTEEVDDLEPETVDAAELRNDEPTGACVLAIALCIGFFIAMAASHCQTSSKSRAVIQPLLGR